VIVSPSSGARRARVGLAALLLLSLVALACRTTIGAPVTSPLEPLPHRVARTPDSADLAAARLAEAASASDRAAVERELANLRSADTLARSGGASWQSSLLPLGHDLANASLDDPIAYREATDELLDTRDLNAAMKGRLEVAVKDDPLRLARKRILDDWQTMFARTFNAVAEPLGKSAITGFSASPYQIAISAFYWGLGMLERQPLTLPERQALVHRKRFVAAHPEAPESDEVREEIARNEEELDRTLRNGLILNAKAAARRGNPRAAKALAEHALHHVPDDGGAQSIVRRANQKISAEHARVARSLLSDAAGLSDLPSPYASPLVEAHLPDFLRLDGSPSRRLSEALLLPGGDYEQEAGKLLASDPDGPLADEAQYALALAQYEGGYEDASFQRLRVLASRDPADSNMARHAEALLIDPWQNPYGSFERVRSAQRNRKVVWHLFGAAASPRQYRRLPPGSGYLLALPSMAQQLISAPVRALAAPWQPSPDFDRPASIAAYRYLAIHPEGEHTSELLRWLFDYEKGRKRYSAALRLADFHPDLGSEERQELLEQTASQHLAAAGRQFRRDRRGAILRDVARSYPDTEAGHDAGILARSEAVNMTPQRIRISRGFIRENPRVAGPQGLGLRPELHDGKLANGELHPEGVTLLGGNVLEIAHVGPEGDDEDTEPVRTQHQVSNLRLARLVSMVDETARHNAQLDPLDGAAADARRDHFFERVRAGLASKPDLRPTAESNFAYQGVRERYGIVRGREGVLPFDIVVQGSLGDLGLGAFPRWREPKQTPDAFLYR